MTNETKMSKSKYIAILLAAVAVAVVLFGGTALISQPAAADEEGYAITVNEGVSLDKFEGQDNYWEAELKYNDDGDKSGDILIYTLENPEKVPVGMEINIQFTANEGYSADLLQVKGEKSGDLIDLNLEETAKGWNGTFLMPEEDVDITAHIQEAVSEEGEDDSDDPNVETYGFTVNGDEFVEKNEDGVWYYEFDHGKVYLDDRDPYKVIETELTDTDYSMKVKVIDTKTDEVYDSCGGDDSMEFLMPGANLDIKVTFDEVVD